MTNGRIVKIVSNDYTVVTAKGRITCKPKGVFRLHGEVPMVGDIVTVSDENVITKIHPRKNQLYRPFVSNVDQVVVVISVRQPNLSSYLLDKLLVIIAYENIKPIICFTKIDLLEDKQSLHAFKQYYQTIGYEVFTNENNEILQVFSDKVTVFAGQTGVGKSSLLNQLDNRLKIKTDEISLALGRGKHTTRHVELYEIGGGYVADTPGFSALDFRTMTAEDIRDNVAEFALYREKCQYRDCYHIREDKCYVKKMLAEGKILKSRYQNYLKFMEEV